jgi:hypothetical protein
MGEMRGNPYRRELHLRFSSELRENGVERSKTGSWSVNGGKDCFCSAANSSGSLFGDENDEGRPASTILGLGDEISNVTHSTDVIRDHTRSVSFSDGDEAILSNQRWEW